MSRFAVLNYCKVFSNEIKQNKNNLNSSSSSLSSSFSLSLLKQQKENKEEEVKEEEEEEVKSEVSEVIYDMLNFLSSENIQNIKENKENKEENKEDSLLNLKEQKYLELNKKFQVVCDCGEVHYLYSKIPFKEIFDLEELSPQNILNLLQPVCGVNCDRQLKILKLIDSLRISMISSDEFISEMEKYFLSQVEYSKKSHLLYCITHGIANNLDSYLVILNLLSKFDFGLKCQTLFSLLNKYPHLSFRCGHYYCFHDGTLSKSRISHECHPIQLSTQSPHQSENKLELNQINDIQNVNLEGESILEVLSDIKKYFEVDPTRIENEKNNYFKTETFNCCFCLEECLYERLFQGCYQMNCYENTSKNVCKECMLSYIENRILSAPYSLPQIKCIGCNTRIPTIYWSTLLQYQIIQPKSNSLELESELQNSNTPDDNKLNHNQRVNRILNKYKQNYSIMRSNRCGSCHNIYTPFPTLLPNVVCPIRYSHSSTISNMDRSLLDGMCKFVGCKPVHLELNTRYDVDFSILDSKNNTNSESKSSIDDTISTNLTSSSSLPSTPLSSSAQLIQLALILASPSPISTTTTTTRLRSRSTQLSTQSQRFSFPLKSNNNERNRSRHSLTTNSNASSKISPPSQEKIKKNLIPSEKLLIVAQTIRSFIRDEISSNELITKLCKLILYWANCLEYKIKREIAGKVLHHSSLFTAIFETFHDIERQASAVNALLSRYPKFKTRCCQSNYCYICKISSFHPDISCQERLRQEKSIPVQFCPSCQVPTIRSEGCTSILCLCGSSWRWVE